MRMPARRVAFRSVVETSNVRRRLGLAWRYLSFFETRVRTIAKPGAKASIDHPTLDVNAMKTPSAIKTIPSETARITPSRRDDLGASSSSSNVAVWPIGEPRKSQNTTRKTRSENEHSQRLVDESRLESKFDMVSQWP